MGSFHMQLKFHSIPHVLQTITINNSIGIVIKIIFLRKYLKSYNCNHFDEIIKMITKHLSYLTIYIHKLQYNVLIYLFKYNIDQGFYFGFYFFTFDSI